MAGRGAFGAGVGKLRMSMILYLVGTIVVLVGFFLGAFNLLSLSTMLGSQGSSYPGYTSGSSYPGFPNYTNASAVASIASVQAIGAAMVYIIPGMIAAIVGYVLSLIAVFLLRSGFKSISSSNRSYGIGTTGALLQLIGFFMFLVGFIAFGALLFVSPGAAIAGSFGMLALVAVGGIISFIGAIMALVGFWRLGSANNSALIQVGAILYLIFPFLGAILLLVGLDPSKIKK